MLNLLALNTSVPCASLVRSVTQHLTLSFIVLHPHLGIDITGHKGTPIMVTAKGKVVYVGKWGPPGLKVQTKHNASASTEYGHLLDAAVKKGQEVD